MSTIRLSGWQRIGIVVTAIYVVLVLVLTGFQYFYPEHQSNCFDTLFVSRELPDSFVFSTPETNPQTGESYKPWEYKFCEDPSTQFVVQLRVWTIFGWGIVAPLVAWLLFWGSVRCFTWVRAGFKQS